LTIYIIFSIEKLGEIIMDDFPNDNENTDLCLGDTEIGQIEELSQLPTAKVCGLEQ
jgi:hypothetical protein